MDALPRQEQREAEAVIRGLAGYQQEWSFPSSSSNAVYSVKWHIDGHVSCNCKGWIFSLRRTTCRSCKHTERVHWELVRKGLKHSYRGEFVYYEAT